MHPDRAKAAAIAGSGSARFGTVRWVERTGSTNTDLLEAARRGEPEQVLVADAQDAGRGRLGRTWVAPPGSSLLCSVLVRPSLGVADGSLVTTAMGLSALDACSSGAGVDLGLKWPNDLVAVTPAGDRKVGGILAEALIEADQLRAVVVGIGLNVAWPTEFPEELAEIATSLSHLGARVDRAELLADLLGRFEWYLDQPAGQLREKYRHRCTTIGRPVRVVQADRTWEGRAVDVNERGELVVATGAGERVVSVGDVVHLRVQPG